MARRKRKATGSITISLERFLAIATLVVPSHKALIAEGYKLKPASRIWRRKDGSFTGRFIYTLPSSASAAVRMTITHVVGWVETE